MQIPFTSKPILALVVVPMLLFQLIGASLYFVTLPGYSEVLYPATKVLMIA